MRKETGVPGENPRLRFTLIFKPQPNIPCWNSSDRSPRVHIPRYLHKNTTKHSGSNPKKQNNKSKIAQTRTKPKKKWRKGRSRNWAGRDWWAGGEQTRNAFSTKPKKTPDRNWKSTSRRKLSSCKTCFDRSSSVASVTGRNWNIVKVTIWAYVNTLPLKFKSREASWRLLQSGRIELAAVRVYKTRD